MNHTFQVTHRANRDKSSEHETTTVRARTASTAAREFTRAHPDRKVISVTRVE